MTNLFSTIDYAKLATAPAPESDWAMASIKSEDAIPQESLLALAACYDKEDPNHVGF